MPSFPPDKISMTAGAWGTDAVKDATTYFGSVAAIRFEDTLPAADPTIESERVTCVPGDVFLVDYALRADSINALATMRAMIFWWDAGLGFLSASALLDGVLPAADTWYRYSGSYTAPTNAAWAGLVFDKNNAEIAGGTSFHAWVGMIGLRKVEPAFWARLGTDQSVNDSATTTVVFGTELYDHGGHYDHTTGIFTVPVDGVYAFSATTEWESAFGDGKRVRLEIDVNGDAGPIVGVQDRYTASASEIPILSSSVAAIYLYRGDVVKVRVRQESGGATDVNAGLASSFFGAKIR